MKKTASFIIALAIILNAVFSFSFSAFASSSKIGESNTYYEYNSTTKTLTISGSGAVPDFKNNSSAVPWYSLRQSGEIENVIVEDGITYLGTYCLYQVKAESISLPSTLKELGNYSLAFSTGITNLELPFGFEKIGQYALSYCTKIKTLSLPDTLSTISNYAFSNCISLTSLTVPYSVNIIGTNAFSGCTALSGVTFQSLTNSVIIGSDAFLGCSNLNSVSIPMKATLGARAFGYNNSNTKNTSFKAYVFSDSNAEIYAIVNSLSYELTDVIPMQCAVLYNITYNQDNIDKTYCFKFTADSNMTYNFYSRGGVDTKAYLKNSSGDTLYENDDISTFSDSNFCISATLNAGETYYLYVSSVRSYGDFCVQVYPNTINTLSADGEVTLSADSAREVDGKRYFDISEEMLSSTVIEITFTNGLTDKLYYKSGYFNTRTFSYTDKQSETPFTCGNNTGYIALGIYRAPINIKINHSYTGTVINPTFEESGYTVYTCTCCGDTYTSDYVNPYTTTVSGNIVLAEDEDFSHSNNVPYSHAKIIAQGREYSVASDGSFSVFISQDSEIIFENEFGNSYSVNVSADESEVTLDTVVLDGYDLNGDFVVNAKDFAISRRTYKNTEIDNYFSTYAHNFY